MKTYDFTIKVADLLHQSGTKDTIQFVNKFSTRFPQLVDSGVCCDVHLTGLNDTDLTIEITDLQATIQTPCDRCGKEFTLTITVPDQYVKASTDPINDEILSIDAKNERIDLEDRLIDSVRMQLPVQIVCKDCEKSIEDEPVDDTEYTTIKRTYAQ